MLQVEPRLLDLGEDLSRRCVLVLDIPPDDDGNHGDSPRGLQRVGERLSLPTGRPCVVDKQDPSTVAVVGKRIPRKRHQMSLDGEVSGSWRERLRAGRMRETPREEHPGGAQESRREGEQQPEEVAEHESNIRSKLDPCQLVCRFGGLLAVRHARDRRRLWHRQARVVPRSARGACVRCPNGRRLSHEPTRGVGARRHAQRRPRPR